MLCQNINQKECLDARKKTRFYFIQMKLKRILIALHVFIPQSGKEKMNLNAGPVRSNFKVNLVRYENAVHLRI